MNSSLTHPWALKLGVKSWEESLRIQYGTQPQAQRLLDRKGPMGGVRGKKEGENLGPQNS